MKNFKRRPILIIPLLQEAYSGRKGVGFESQGAGASTYLNDQDKSSMASNH